MGHKQVLLLREGEGREEGKREGRGREGTPQGLGHTPHVRNPEKYPAFYHFHLVAKNNSGLISCGTSG